MQKKWWLLLCLLCVENIAWGVEKVGFGVAVVDSEEEPQEDLSAEPVEVNHQDAEGDEDLNLEDFLFPEEEKQSFFQRCLAGCKSAAVGVQKAGQGAVDFCGFMTENALWKPLARDMLTVFERDLLPILIVHGLCWDAQNQEVDGLFEGVRQGLRDAACAVIPKIVATHGLLRLYMHVTPLTMKLVGDINGEMGHPVSLCQTTCSSKARLQGNAGSIVTMVILATNSVTKYLVVPQVGMLMALWTSFQLAATAIESGCPNDCWMHINKRIKDNAAEITMMALLLSQLPIEAQVISTLFLAGSVQLDTSFAPSQEPVSKLNHYCYLVAGLPRNVVEALLPCASNAVERNILDRDPRGFPKLVVWAVNKGLQQHDRLSKRGFPAHIQMSIEFLVPLELFNAKAFSRDPILREALLSRVTSQGILKIETIIETALATRNTLTGRFVMWATETVPLLEDGIAAVAGVPTFILDWVRVLLRNAKSVEDIEGILTCLKTLRERIPFMDQNTNPTLAVPPRITDIE